MLSSEDLMFGDAPDDGAIPDSLGVSYFDGCRPDGDIPSTSWLSG